MKSIDYLICLIFILFTFISLSCNDPYVENDYCYGEYEYRCCDVDACNYSSNSCYACDSSSCYYTDSICYGDVNNNGYYDIAITIDDCDFNCVLLEGNWSISIENGIEKGCMIPAANNYSFFALEDDGSCHGGSGCTNIVDAEYDYWATIDDGSCINP